MDEILNLVDKNKSTINYDLYAFPDGQHQVIIKDSIRLSCNKNSEVTIKARINNFSDLEKVICATKSLNEIGINKIHLYVPYILGSRSDRKFEEGGNNYIKEVISPIINSLNFLTVKALDPHSDVLEACIKNFKYTNNEPLLMLFFNKHPELNVTNTTILSPDAGASKKIFKIVDKFPKWVSSSDGEYDISICGKDRDENGRITRVIVPKDIDKTRNIIIIDDICDGGGTFINIAKKLRENGHVGKIYLVVTHGIFSKGFDVFKDVIDAIYTTDSYSTLPTNYSDGIKKYSTSIVTQILPLFI